MVSDVPSCLPVSPTAVNDESTSGVAAGIYVSAIGATTSLLLYAYKRHYGRVLKSIVLLAVSE